MVSLKDYNLTEVFWNIWRKPRFFLQIQVIYEGAEVDAMTDRNIVAWSYSRQI